MTFTFPYGTYAFKCMPFGHCNRPATFHRCMITIFHDMVEDFEDLFMDEFSVFGEFLTYVCVILTGFLFDVRKKYCIKLGNVSFPNSRRHCPGS